MNTVITIHYQFGSNGRRIGRLLAQKMGLPFHDELALRRDGADPRERCLALSQDGPCVLAGRAADRAAVGGIRVFIHAPLADRIRRVAERREISPARAEELVASHDARQLRLLETARPYHIVLDSGQGDQEAMAGRLLDLCCLEELRRQAQQISRRLPHLQGTRH